MNGNNRKDIKPGLRVNITQKQDQRSGRLTSGVVKTSSRNLPSTRAASKSGLQPGKWDACKRLWRLAICRCAMPERDVHTLRAEALATLAAATQAANGAPDVESAIRYLTAATQGVLGG